MILSMPLNLWPYKLRTFKTIREKFASSEAIHQIELTDDIDKAENFTKPVADSVHIVLFEVEQ